VQVIVVPKGVVKSDTHLKYRMPNAAVGATFEQTTRLLCLLFAQHGLPQTCKLGFYVFDADYQRLSKVGVELPWQGTNEDLVDVEGQLISGMPCILLPQQAASWENPSAVSKKVMRPRISC
jgi:hypothetical protein